MESFKINREGFLIGEKTRQCTNCRAMFEKTSRTVTLCNSCNSSRVKSQSAESKMLRRAKSRAKEKSLEFNISIDDIFIPKECPILKIPLISKKGRPGCFDSSPSLDRIDPEKGYIKGNIMVISSLANVMKNNASVKNLINFSKYILEAYKSAEE